MVLAKYDIERLCADQQMICGYKKENIQANSYDLCMGNQYCCDDNLDKNKPEISKLGDKTSDDEFEIPADAICYVISEEELKMPNNITGDVSLAFGLIKQGIMLAKQPPIDPGYRGKIVALLHNLSDEPVRIRKGDHILSMVFYELKHAVAPTDLYKGSYQHLDDLGMYCKTVKRGAIYSLARDFEKTKETLEKQLEQTKIDIAKESTNKQLAIMNVITIIIAIVTVLLTVITGFLTVNTFRNPDNEGEETAFEQETIVDDNNKISIGSYKIEIKSGNIVNVTVDETGKEILIDIGMDGETE